MLAQNSIVAVYDTQTEVETAVRDLQEASFDLKKISVLGREYGPAEETSGYYHTPGGTTRYWGSRSAFWNQMWTLLDSAGCFSLPGLGRVLIAGPLTQNVADAMEDEEAGVEGLSPIGAGLQVMSIPKPCIVRYESALRMHRLLAIAYGSVQEVLRCKDILHASLPKETNVHFAADPVLTAA